MVDIKELKEEELEKASGGKHIEAVDGVYHFIKNQVFFEYISPNGKIKNNYFVGEDKYATINDTVFCRVEMIYDGDPCGYEEKNVSVAKLIEFEML